MANPPLNVDEVDADKIKSDRRRLPFGLPGVNKNKKVSNANYLWIQYFYSYLNDTGKAGFVMSSQASSAGRDEAKVREQLVRTGHVDIMVDIRGNFFYTRSVPCQLWFLNKNKPEHLKDKVLMLDARNVYRKVTRKIYDFSPEQQQNLTAVVWLYGGQTDRFIELVKHYIDRSLMEAHACELLEEPPCQPLPDFFGQMNQLSLAFQPFMDKLEQDGVNVEHYVDFLNANGAANNSWSVFGMTTDDLQRGWNQFDYEDASSLLKFTDQDACLKDLANHSRDRGLGPTIIVSPLLALMRNQIESARNLGIVAETMNSTNSDDWQAVTQRMLNDEIDCLLISPERLANDRFIETVLQPIADRIGLMVVDEAHCISDWGHDFRPDYRRIVSILQQLPPNTPVLGTTATANNRVVADIQTQLGDIRIQRGPLTRKSLALQTQVLPDQASRLAWLAQVIPTLEGTGIIYTLTVRDAEQVAQWLNAQGINAKAYHGSIKADGFDNSNLYRQHLETLLLNNNLKVLVATTALGMGYDKPDLSFVIHYQAPGSIVAYYQQVGRAGRGIDRAVGVLMSGTEDGDIHEFFRDAAFPSQEHVREILELLAQSDGLSIRTIEEQTNLRHGQIEKVLKLLSVENPAPVVKMGNQWRRTAVPFAMDQARIDHLTHQREQEWNEVQAYLNETGCKMAFLRRALDDEDTTPCGKCESCIGRPVINQPIDPALAHQAATFLKHAEMVISPKAQVAANAFVEYGFTGNLPQNLRAQEGRVLSRWVVPDGAGWLQIKNTPGASAISW